MRGASALEQDNILACIADRWFPTIGDPHLMGWLTVAFYALTAVLATRVLTSGAVAGRVRLFWGLVALAMAFLAVNKQLDLQSALTALGRCIALRDGWYDDRGPFQRRILLGLGLGALAVLTAGLYVLRRDLRRNLAALAGLSFVAGFVMMRAVGYHGFDALINAQVEGVRMNWVLEWAGLVLIAWNAIVLRRAADPFARLRNG